MAHAAEQETGDRQRGCVAYPRPGLGAEGGSPAPVGACRRRLGCAGRTGAGRAKPEASRRSSPETRFLSKRGKKQQKTKNTFGRGSLPHLQTNQSLTFQTEIGAAAHKEVSRKKNCSGYSNLTDAGAEGTVLVGLAPGCRGKAGRAAPCPVSPQHSPVPSAETPGAGRAPLRTAVLPAGREGLSRVAAGIPDWDRSGASRSRFGKGHQAQYPRKRAKPRFAARLGPFLAGLRGRGSARLLPGFPAQGTS